ncbi:hypothetical protein HMPREF9542_00304 [Escherichia coli MS 117-3]|nr:hypothetical protein HMPREF9542_00304 [Escherichia coli MS 117-3]
MLCLQGVALCGGGGRSVTTRNRISGEEKKDYCRKVKKTAHCCGEWIIAQKAKFKDYCP